MSLNALALFSYQYLPTLCGSISALFIRSDFMISEFIIVSIKAGSVISDFLICASSMFLKNASAFSGSGLLMAIGSSLLSTLSGIASGFFLIIRT